MRCQSEPSALFLAVSKLYVNNIEQGPSRRAIPGMQKYIFARRLVLDLQQVVRAVLNISSNIGEACQIE